MDSTYEDAMHAIKSSIETNMVSVLDFLNTRLERENMGLHGEPIADSFVVNDSHNGKKRSVFAPIQEIKNEQLRHDQNHKTLMKKALV